MTLPVHPFQTTNASKLLVIDALALAFERAELRLLDDPDPLGELLAYAAERLPPQPWSLQRPGGQSTTTAL